MNNTNINIKSYFNNYSINNDETFTNQIENNYKKTNISTNNMNDTSKIAQSLLDEKIGLRKELKEVKDRYVIIKNENIQLKQANEEKTQKLKEFQMKNEKLIKENEILKKNHGQRIDELENHLKELVKINSENRQLKNSLYLENNKKNDYIDKISQLEKRIKELNEEHVEELSKKDMEIRELKEKNIINYNLENDDNSTLVDSEDSQINAVKQLSDYIKNFNELMKDIVKTSNTQNETMLNRFNDLFNSENEKIKSIIDLFEENKRLNQNEKKEREMNDIKTILEHKNELMELFDKKIKELDCMLIRKGSNYSEVNSLYDKISGLERILNIKNSEIQALSALTRSLKSKIEVMKTKEINLENTLSNLKDFIYKNVNEDVFEEFMQNKQNENIQIDDYN
jgi:chromosome segregation ATPase